MTIEETFEAVVRKVVREELEARAAAAPGRPELITYEQAAELVGVAVSTVKEWVKEGVLPVLGPRATAGASSRRVRPADVVAVFRRVDGGAASTAPEVKQHAARILATLPLRRAR